MIGLLLFTACSDYELKSLSTPIEKEESYLSANTDGLINIEEEEDTSAEEVGSTVEFTEHFQESVALEVRDVDIAFVLDSTGSMEYEAISLSREFSGIVEEISYIAENAAYGFATFDDYNGGGFGKDDDHPFTLHNQITTDILSVQASLNDIPIHYGGDIPESGMEALYQSLTGLGYDQNGVR